MEAHNIVNLPSLGTHVLINDIEHQLIHSVLSMPRKLKARSDKM